MFKKAILLTLFLMFIPYVVFSQERIDVSHLKFNFDPPISTQYSQASLKQIFSTLSQMGKINVIYDEGVQLGKVIPSFGVKDLPFSKTLDVLLTTNSLNAIQVSDDTIIVMPSTRYQTYIKSEKRIFSLTYIEAAKIMPIVQSMFTAQQQLLKFISDEKRNSLIVVGPKETIEEIGKLLKDMDQKVSQVVVELIIVEASHQKNVDLGSKLNNYQMPSNQLVPDYRGTSWDSFPALIQYLQTTSNVKTLANPNVRVVDKQKATISVTDQIPIQLSTSQISSNTTTAGGTPTAYTTTQVQFYDIGIKLTITPTIHSDNEVTIDLTAEISSLGKMSAINGIPEIGKRNVQTIIRLKDNETNILSGLKKEEERVTKTHLPILSDLPLIGVLFDFILGETSTQKIETEIIMSITPHIILANK